eukprot:TRINITY_DN39060_c0_g1_i1.p1 TRINITY_DN39060_c0_g1~~TRINITY_DN39060_c0_g1_i1.p1  ORF type:complete len:426 (+),score=51.59 TRINITY_DN39060_c0_g1_i1:55-1278(+)
MMLSSRVSRCRLAAAAAVLGVVETPLVAASPSSLVSAAAQTMFGGPSCGSAADCRSCDNSYTCHWCGYGYGCHAIGSVYGCAIGVSCMANTECVRKAPEYLGHTRAPLEAGVLGVFLFALALVCLLGCHCKLRLVSLRETSGAAVELSSSAQGACEGESTDRRGETGRLRLAARALRCPRFSSSFERPTGRRCLISCIVLVVSLAFCCLLVSHWPREPVVSYCNKELQWSGLIESLATSVVEGNVTVRLEQLLSVYNPNRVDVTLESIRVKLTYPPESSDEVGSISLDGYAIPAGHVSDALATISFDVNKWTAMELAKSYYEGSLKIGAFAGVVYRLNAYGVRVIASSFSESMVIDTAAPSDTLYCHCAAARAGGSDVHSAQRPDAGMVAEASSADREAQTSTASAA